MRIAERKPRALAALGSGLLCLALAGCGGEEIPLEQAPPPEQPSQEKVEALKKNMPAKGQISKINPMTGKPVE